MRRAILAGLVLAAVATVPGCDDPGGVEPDAAAIDAEVEACLGGNAIDVSQDPTVPAVSWPVTCDHAPAPVPGLGDGSMYRCGQSSPLNEWDARSWVARTYPDGTQDLEGELARSFCTAVFPLDDHRVITGRRITFPLPGDAVLVVSDFTTHTSEVIELPAPPGRLLVLDLQALPDGILVSGWSWPDATSDTPHDIAWQLDAGGAVVRTWLDDPRGVIIPSSMPVRLARIAGDDRVALVDLDSRAVLETRTLPMTVERLVAGPQGVVAFGRRGCDVAAMPIDSSIATVLPDVRADLSSATLDDRGRVVVAADLGDRHTVALFRLDDARFDGADGASRIDPTLGPGGHAHAEIGLPCVTGDPCAPGQWHDRGRAYVVSVGPDLLSGCATYFDLVAGANPSVWGQTYRMP